MLAIKRKSTSAEKSPQVKSSKQIERHMKGVANYRRIEIMFLIADNEGISVENIARKLRCNTKTISGHLFRLMHAGLIRKSSRGLEVAHELSPYGKIFHKFLVSFRYLK